MLRSKGAGEQGSGGEGMTRRQGDEEMGKQGGKEEIPPVASFLCLLLPLEADRDIIVVETIERREGKGK